MYQPQKDLFEPITEHVGILFQKELQFFDGICVHAFDLGRIEADMFEVNDAFVDRADLVIVRSVIQFEFDEWLDLDAFHTKFFRETTLCRLNITFTGLHMFRDRTVERQWRLQFIPASLLHKQFAARREQKDMCAAMPHSALMNNGSHFLTNNLVILIDDVK